MKKTILFLITTTAIMTHTEPDQDEIVRRMYKLIRKCAALTGAEINTPYESQIGEKYRECVCQFGKADTVATWAFFDSRLGHLNYAESAFSWVRVELENNYKTLAEYRTNPCIRPWIGNFLQKLEEKYGYAYGTKEFVKQLTINDFNQLATQELADMLKQKRRNEEFEEMYEKSKKN